MKRVLLLCFALLTPSLTAQTPSQTQPRPTTAPPTDQPRFIIPEGTYLQITLREPVSSKLSDIGDEVMATLKKDVVVNGELLLKEGTEILGQVTLAKPAKRPLKGGLLHIRFDRIRFDSGLERKLVALVQSASNFARDEKINGNGEGTLKGGKGGGEVLRNVGTAAGIGGSVAMIIVLAGNNGYGVPYGYGGVSGGSAVAAASALGGSMAAGVLLSKGKEVRLEPGTMVRLKLERPVVLD